MESNWMRIAHARSSEAGTKNGVPGDQTGKEVSIDSFFEYDWDYVFRAKDPSTREKIADYAEKICGNENCGYGQGDRYGVYLAAKENGWQFDKIDKPVNTDCSQMVASILLACGINVSPYMYTGNERGQITATGRFMDYTYTKKEDLLRGDVLLTTRKGHTGVVLDDGRAAASGSAGAMSQEPKFVIEIYGAKTVSVRTQPYEAAKALAAWPVLGVTNLVDVCDEAGSWYYVRIAGKYFGWIPKENALRKSPVSVGKVITALHLRQNAGVLYRSLCVMPEGATVQICDQKNAAGGAAWDYVYYNGRYGFCSHKYIK